MCGLTLIGASSARLLCRRERDENSVSADRAAAAAATAPLQKGNARADK